MTTQPAGDHRVGLTTLDPDTDLFALLERQRIGTLLYVSRNTTTASSPTRRRNVLTDTPANAAASAYVAPPRHRHQPRPTTDRGNLDSTHPTPPHTGAVALTP